MIEKIVYISSDNKYFSTSYAKKTYPSSMTENHYHSFYEIVYIYSGQRAFLVKDKSYLLNKGDIIFINPFDFHRSIDAKDPYYERILISFRKEFIIDFMKQTDINYFYCFDNEIDILHFTEEQQIYVENVLSKLIDEFVYKNSGHELVIKSLLLEFLIYVSRIGMNTSNNHEYTYLNDTHRRISEIIRFVNSNYEKELTLTNIANKFYFSPTYLSKTFKKIMGVSLVSYISQVRIRAAQNLLISSSISITEICEKVGFNNINQFERTCKSSTGKTPSQFRKTYKIHS